MKRVTLTEGMRGRFAVVKLWPKIQVAEDEVIARLKAAAAGLGLECVEMLADGRAVAAPHAPITREDVDFAIHLHFDTPKAYDLFSFVALWNPARLIHNYAREEFVRCSRNLATHDDFLSCGSAGADDHLRRTLLPDPTRDGPRFTMYHSVANPIFEPTLGDRKIVYVGINWERLSGAKGRHQELLKLLDESDVLRIYGPRVLQGVRVWKGYQSYVEPLPFDGVSVIQALHASGIGLVLASEPHKEDGVMSCRLFETVAAGAVVICDDHPFARQHFGDTLLYIDTSGSAQDSYEQVMEHVRWIQNNHAAALDMVRRAQQIFSTRFALELSLQSIYEGFAARKQELDLLQAPSIESRATLFFLLPEFDRDELSRHIKSIEAQEHESAEYVLLVGELDYSQHADEITTMLRACGKKVECRPTKFLRAGRVPQLVKLGRILNDIVSAIPDGHLFGFVGPREQLMSNHMRSLVGCLSRNPEAACAYSDVTLKAPTLAPDGSPVLALQWEIDLLGADPNRPLGFGRFMFRQSNSLVHARLAMPHMHHKPMAALVSQAKCVASRRATVMSLLAPAGTKHPSAADIRFEDVVLEPCLPDAETMRILAARPQAGPSEGISSRAFQRHNMSIFRRSIKARAILRPIERALRPLRHKMTAQR